MIQASSFYGINEYMFIYKKLNNKSKILAFSSFVFASYAQLGALQMPH